MDHKEVVLYTDGRSLRSWRAKRLLRRSGCRFEVLEPPATPKYSPTSRGPYTTRWCCRMFASSTAR